MKVSFNYAIEFGSEVPPEIQADVMEEVWADMEVTAQRNRERVDFCSEVTHGEELITAEGLDYAIIGISEYPRPVVIYDYWKCLEVMMIGGDMTEEEAVEALTELIESYTDANEPVFITPFDSFDDDDGDDDDDDGDDEEDDDFLIEEDEDEINQSV